MRRIATAAAILCASSGTLGMLLSLFFLSGTELDIAAGTAGFIAGAILLGASVISMALLART